MKSHHTAILLFTRSAKEEATFKRVSGKKRLNQRFFSTLINHSRRTAVSTGLPLFTTDQQQGNTFGERLAHAIQQVFDQGFERIITIGNDSPGLTTEMILQATNQLDHHDLVIGPARDGGTYLIGLHKNAFDQQTWSHLDWSEAHSFQDLIAFARQHDLRFSIGEELADIDCRRELHLLLNFSGQQFQRLKLLVVSLLTTYLNIPLQDRAITLRPVRFAFGLKAPPFS